MSRHSGAGVLARFVVGLALLAPVAALAPTQESAVASVLGEGAGPFSSASILPVPVDGLAYVDTVVPLDPELQRVYGGVSYKVDVRPEVFFTFDDGPDHGGVTDRILDILDTYNAKATFFVVGRAAEAFPEQIARIVNEGHSLGNHTYSHPRLTSLSTEQVRGELTRASELLERLSGHRIACYRPPEGKVDDRVHAVAVELGVGNKTWTAEWGGHWGLWDVDTWDWRGGRERTMDALADISEGDVVLMHSLRNFSADVFSEWMEANHHRFDFNVLPGCMHKADRGMEADRVIAVSTSPGPPSVAAAR